MPLLFSVYDMISKLIVLTEKAIFSYIKCIHRITN